MRLLVCTLYFYCYLYTYGILSVNDFIIDQILFDLPLQVVVGFVCVHIEISLQPRQRSTLEFSVLTVVSLALLVSINFIYKCMYRYVLLC
jgi:hypothetical protein